MADREHHSIANDVTHAHGVVWQTVADAAALAALTIIAEDIAQQKVILQADTRELWVPLTTAPTFRHLILPATTSIAGEMSATDKTKLNGISAGADVALPSLATHVADVSNPHAVTAAQAGAVPTSRTLTTTAPLKIGGGASANLSVDRTLSIDAATTSAPGTLSAADKTKLDGISAGADVTSAALVAAGTTTAAVAATANKLELSPTSMGTITTGTTQPISFTDALFTGLVTGGTAVGSGGTVGVVASAFASSGAETGTGSGQGGLGSAASSSQPYNSTDFVGGRFHCDLFKSNSEPLVLSDVLTTAAASFPASVAAPVILYLSRRTDLGADLKWRGWFYFRNQATGNLTPVTPDISVATVTLRIPQVFLSKDVPTSALYTPIASLGSAEVVFGATGDVANLGTKAAGAIGKVADIGHVHTMPSADQLAACAGDVSLNTHKLTGGAAATAQSDFALLSQTALGILALWNYQKNKGAATTCFVCCANGNNAIVIPDTVESSSKIVMPQAGTVTAMYVTSAGAAIADSQTFTVRKNGVDTAVTCVMAGGTVTANDTGHSFAFVAGDVLSIKVVQSSTAASVVTNTTVSLAWRAT
jgi:hypothetical protein